MGLRDKNRYRKIYSFIRRKPVNEVEGDVVYESGEAAVTSDEVIINFTTSFNSAPYVTATAYDSETNGEANVNVYIVSVTAASVTLGFSASFTGKVQYHAIQSA